MQVCDWCHSTNNVVLVSYEMVFFKHEREAIQISQDLCQKCREAAAEAIRQSLLELMEKKKAARVPIPEN